MDEWYLLFIRPIQNLLSLGTRTLVRTSHFTVISEVETSDDENSRIRRRPVEVFWRGLKHDTDKQEDLKRDAMLFTLGDMGTNFEAMTNKWFEISQNLEGILNLYFSVRGNPDTYLEHQFLSTVQVLEGYHRLRFSNEVLPRDEYDKRREAILAAIPSEYLSWIKGKFQFGNEPSLRVRLHQLINFAGQVIEPWIAGGGGEDNFTRNVRDIRGTLTHPGTSAVDGDRLYELTEALSFLFEACLLLELGFDTDRTVNLFRQNQRYGFASRRTSS